MTADIRYEVPQPEVLERRLADRPGEHLWTFTAAWLIHDPERDQFWLDAEGMVAAGGVGLLQMRAHLLAQAGQDAVPWQRDGDAAVSRQARVRLDAPVVADFTAGLATI